MSAIRGGDNEQSLVCSDWLPRSGPLLLPARPRDHVETERHIQVNLRLRPMHGAKASNAVPAAIDNKPTPYSLGLSCREDYSVFGKLTRLFVKVLISWISRRRSAPHSHRQRERERVRAPHLLQSSQQ